MSLHWYACISTNTCCFEMHHILLETNWWALPNTSSIVWICSAVHEILADEAFTATDGLISQLFVVAFVHPTYVWIALIWGFPAQLSLWKVVHWLWKYKLNEVCNKTARNGYQIPMVQGGLPHKLYFIAIDNREQIIIGPNKKIVATHVVGELEVLI